MVDDDSSDGPELIRPYVIAPGDPPPRRTTPPRRPAAARPPVDDPTVVLDMPTPVGDPPSHRRPRRVPAIAAAAGIAVVALGAYLVWPSGAAPRTAPVAGGVTVPVDVPSSSPAATRTTATASVVPPRPVATHPASPSPSTASPTPAPPASRTAFVAPTESKPPPPPPVPGPIVGLGGRCVDNNGATTGNGNRIQLYDCNGSVAQVWTFAPDGTLRVQGKCLRAGTPAPGVNVDLWDCDAGPGQVWAPRGDTLVNVASGLCLDAPRPGNGAALDVAACTGVDGQRWRFGVG